MYRVQCKTYNCAHWIIQSIHNIANILEAHKNGSKAKPLHLSCVLDFGKLQVQTDLSRILYDTLEISILLKTMLAFAATE